MNRLFRRWQAGTAPLGDNTHQMEDRRAQGGDLPAFFKILTGDNQ